MPIKKRDFPSGVEVKHPFELQYFLPYRIHRLALRIGNVGSGSDGESYSVMTKNGYDLKTREWRVIASLACRGPLTNSEIAELTSIETATVTRASKSLAANGFIQSAKIKTDKRKALISLTSEGAALFDAISKPRQKQIDRIESCLTEKEKETFYRILGKLDDQALLETKDSELPEVEWE